MPATPHQDARPTADTRRFRDVPRVEHGRRDRAQRFARGAAQHAVKYWAAWLALVACLVAAGLGLHTGIERLLVRWIWPYDHSGLVLLMCAWLLAAAAWRQPPERVAPSAWGVLAAAAALLGYAVAEIIDFSLGMQVMLPAILLGIVTAIGGMQIGRAALIPAAMLYFTIPIWDLTVVPLQRLSVAAVTFALGIYGPPAYIDGNVISIPAGTFEIAEGCAGMRYFMVGLAMAAFYGFNWYARWRPRIALLAVAGAAAMLSNWLRIYTLILIGQATDMQHYVIAESHDGYGWLVYVLAMAPVLWFARWLETREGATARPAPAPGVGTTLAAPRAFLAVGALVAAMAATPALIRAGTTDAGGPGEVSLLPAALGEWRQVAPDASWQPTFAAAYLHERRTYARAGAAVDVYVARYPRQHPGAKVTAAINRHALHSDWHVSWSGTRPVAFAGHRRVAQATELAEDGERRAVWYWYVVGGTATHSRTRAKLLEVTALLAGRRDGAVIALSAPCAARCDEAEDAMSGFLEDGAGVLLEALANGDTSGP